MVWTTPRTWVTAEMVTAALMNTHVRDNLDWLIQAHGCAATGTADQAITTGVMTAVQWDGTDEWDSDAFHDPASNNTRLTVPRAGRYLVIAGVYWEAVAAGVNREVHLRTDGSTTASGGRVNQSATVAAPAVYQVVSSILPMGGGTYVECLVGHDRGSNLNLQRQDSRFQIVWLGDA